MANKIIFLSHITEEKELAGHIKDAIESEFSGFVDVFVSSDGVSIPAGSNFLKRIEGGLVGCIGAIYLISPASVARPWINFELGAVWIRSAISQRSGGPEVPALPFCHSGMKLGSLPAPIGSLNAIQANEASQLRFAFQSLQTAVGGKGVLRTNFDDLATKVKSLETKYMVTKHVAEVLSLMGVKPSDVISVCRADPAVTDLDFGERHFTERQYERLEELANGPLAGIVTVEYTGLLTTSGATGGKSGPTAKISCKSEPILKLDN